MKFIFLASILAYGGVISPAFSADPTPGDILCEKLGVVGRTATLHAEYYNNIDHKKYFTEGDAGKGAVQNVEGLTEGMKDVDEKVEPHYDDEDGEVLGFCFSPSFQQPLIDYLNALDHKAKYTPPKPMLEAIKAFNATAIHLRAKIIKSVGRRLLADHQENFEDLIEGLVEYLECQVDETMCED